MTSGNTTTEDDLELRDLVTTSLSQAGVLGKIKAQLRANVYLALEEGDAGLKSRSSLANPPLAAFLSTTSGRLIGSLVREFLQFFNLDFSLAVFDPETNLGKDFKYREREHLVEALGLTELMDHKAPLLTEIMRLSKVSVLKSESPTPSDISQADDQHTSAPISLVDDPSRGGDEKSEVSLAYSHSHSKSKDKSYSLDPQHSLSHSSSKSEETTPEIILEDTSLDNLLGRNTSKVVTTLESKCPLGENALLKSDSKILPSPKEIASSFLNDLPPLGGIGRSSLPPLSSDRPKALAPLEKKINSSQPSSQDPIISKPFDMNPMKGSLKSNVPSFGFEPDHVLSQKEESPHSKSNKLKDSREKSELDTNSDVTENIEEELDSFLNSDLSAAEDVTRDETLMNSEASLKVDFAESL